MSPMFCGCSSLIEINLSSFKTDKATYMKLMFAESSSFEKIDLFLLKLIM